MSSLCYKPDASLSIQTVHTECAPLVPDDKAAEPACRKVPVSRPETTTYGVVERNGPHYTVFRGLRLHQTKSRVDEEALNGHSVPQL